MALGSIVEGQGSQVQKANALFDAVTPAALYARDASACSGLAIGLHSGWISINGVRTEISAYSDTVGASTVTYVEANPSTGAVSKNTTSFTAGYWPLHKVTSGTATVTAWEDQRGAMPRLTPLLTKAFPSDANYTLTQAEASCDIISITAGTITTTRDFIVPISFPKVWTVINKTAQSVRIIGATGTGITIAAAKTATVMADGTNVVRLTADV